ncbi:MAG: aldo/keto reductase [Acidobacteriota bacterium]
MSNCSRRNFIKGAMLVGTASLLGCNENSDAKIFEPPAATVPPNTLAEKVPGAVLGKTGVKVPILVNGGAYQYNSVMVGRSYELGLTYFDTADCYAGGQSEISLGRILEKQGWRKDVWITSKDHPRQPSDMLTTIDKRLENLRTDYLDLYFIHQLGDGEYPKECVDWPKGKELKEVAETLKKQKKIKFFGFSCHAGILPQALENAAEGGFVDVIMFRYNFREQSDVLNRAIDKAKKANIGLIAMKTQGGKVLNDNKLEEFKSKGFNMFQSTLKAVWSDTRIDTICSHMPSVQIIQENAVAAVQNKISALERKMLEEYAAETNHLICRGCDHICSPHATESVRIGDTLRYLMYHENYGEHEMARDLFANLSREARASILNTDFTAAEAACPYNVKIGEMMARAAKKLA